MVRRATVLLLAIALLCGPASAAGKTTERLVADLADIRQRAKAYAELKKRKDPRAIAMLESILPSLDWVGQYWGVLILEAYGKGERIDSALRSLAAQRNPHLRATAGSALYRRGDRSTVPAIADALATPGIDAPVRVQMIWRVLPVKETAIWSALGELLKPKADETVISAALYVLGVHLARPAIPSIRGLLEDERILVRSHAAVLLHRFGEEEHAGVIAEAIGSGKLTVKLWPRYHLQLYWTGRYPKAILDALTERIPEEPNPTVLTQMIWHLGAARHRPAVEPLRKLVDHAEPTVAAAAFAALLRIPGALPPEKLLPLLTARKASVRLRAAEALRRGDDGAGLPAVIEVRETSASPEERVEAVRILSTFRKSAAVSPLVDALLDAAPTVRARAVLGLTNLLATLFPYRSFQIASTGYDAKRKPAENAAAVETIRAWWKKARSEDW
jgi:HEAT repeat protein